jgi:hypothetical protein
VMIDSASCISLDILIPFKNFLFNTSGAYVFCECVCLDKQTIFNYN